MVIPLAFITTCAIANVAPQTVAAIIQVESRGDPFALNINGAIASQQHPATEKEALAAISAATAQGASVDIGLMQVNTANVFRFGYTVKDMLDPCTNIKVGSMILSDDYRNAVAVAPAGQEALKAALSAYNTGNFRSGFDNGYVAQYFGGRVQGPGADKRSLTQNPFTSSTTIFHRSEPHAAFGNAAAPTAAGRWPSE